MNDNPYNSGWFGCLVLAAPYVIIGVLMLLYYAIRNHAIQIDIIVEQLKDKVMTKSKVGAEPKGRVKHSFTRDAGIHEGIHRDEPGWYDGKLHCYCFGYGYFFHRGKSLGTKLTPDYIKENWDKEGWCGGLKGACMAVINRERRIELLKNVWKII